MKMKKDTFRSFANVKGTCQPLEIRYYKVDPQLFSANAASKDGLFTDLFTPRKPYSSDTLLYSD